MGCINAKKTHAEQLGSRKISLRIFSLRLRVPA